MRNRIFGAIGVIWGGSILLFGLLKGGPEGSGAYAQGQGIVPLLRAALFSVGLYYLIKGKGKAKAQE